MDGLTGRPDARSIVASLAAAIPKKAIRVRKANTHFDAMMHNLEYVRWVLKSTYGALKNRLNVTLATVKIWFAILSIPRTI